eukprot:3743913-Prymnesium_polylepis.1
MCDSRPISAHFVLTTRGVTPAYTGAALCLRPRSVQARPTRALCARARYSTRCRHHRRQWPERHPRQRCPGGRRGGRCGGWR